VLNTIIQKSFRERKSEVLDYSISKAFLYLYMTKRMDSFTQTLSNSNINEIRKVIDLVINVIAISFEKNYNIKYIQKTCKFRGGYCE
jgi:hypothetical protein